MNALATQITKDTDAASDPAFAELFDRFWAGNVAGEAALAEAAFVERVLRVPHGGLIVVAPSGCGNLALALASRGNRIHAVDASEDSIAHARLLAARSHAAAWFSCRPGIALPAGSAFDGLVCVRHGFDAPALAALLVRLAGIPTGAPSATCRERPLILCERI